MLLKKKLKSLHKVALRLFERLPNLKLLKKKLKWLCKVALCLVEKLPNLKLLKKKLKWLHKVALCLVEKLPNLKLLKKKLKWLRKVALCLFKRLPNLKLWIQWESTKNASPDLWVIQVEACKKCFSITRNSGAISMIKFTGDLNIMACKNALISSNH